jgi:chemotaxis protein MotB
MQITTLTYKEFLSDQKPNDEKELSASSLEAEQAKKQEEARVEKQLPSV